MSSYRSYDFSLKVHPHCLLNKRHPCKLVLAHHVSHLQACSVHVLY